MASILPHGTGAVVVTSEPLNVSVYTEPCKTLKIPSVMVIGNILLIIFNEFIPPVPPTIDEYDWKVS